MKNRRKVPLLRVAVLLTAVVIGCGVFSSVIRTLKQERIALNGQESWLEGRWEERLGEIEIDEIRKTADDREGALTVQLWEITAAGHKNIDIVVWRQTVCGNARVVYTQWVDAEYSDTLSDFAFRDGFFWYGYGVSSERDELFGPEKVFALL